MYVSSWYRKNCVSCGKKPLTSSRLNAAKKQIIGQIGVASDNFENNALDMAKCFLHYKHYDSKEELFHRIEALTASQLQDIANEMFCRRLSFHIDLYIASCKLPNCLETIKDISAPANAYKSIRCKIINLTPD